MQIFELFDVSYSIFYCGSICNFFFLFELQWFPFQGSVDIKLKEGTFEYYMSKIYHTFLPALTLGLLSTAGYIQYLRVILLKILKRLCIDSKVKRIIYE